MLRRIRHTWPVAGNPRQPVCVMQPDVELPIQPEFHLSQPQGKIP